MPAGRPKKSAADKGNKKIVFLYQKEINILNSIKSRTNLNHSEIIRLSIDLLDFFDDEFILEKHQETKQTS